jgi:hypothetical protein
MSELAQNIEVSDDLDCWWSPGQWFRIVYGVWIDQLWYWQNVRPHLRGRTQGWGIFAQALLGTSLLAAMIVLGISQLLISQNIPINPAFMAVGFGISLVIVILIGGMAGMIGGVGASVPPIVCLGVLLIAASLAGNMNWGISHINDWKTASLVGLLFAFFGIVLGIVRSVVDGEVSLIEISLEAILIGMGTGKDLGVEWGIITGIAICAGALTGMKWATRQVPEREERKKLARGAEQQKR